MRRTCLFILMMSFLPVSSYARKLPENTIPVPLVRQATDYSCGAASLLAVLLYWKKFDGPESELYPLIKTTPENGTDPLNIVAYTQTLGLEVELKTNLKLEDVESMFDEGFTAILDFQAWTDERVKNKITGGWRDKWEDGHYAVLVAYDARNFYFMDPSLPARYGFIPKKEFIDRWHDYEIRDGVRVENYQLGIFIRGKRPMVHYPASIMRIE